MSKKKNKESNIIKILVWADSPYCSTGFANVVRGIFGNLSKTGQYYIDIIGINDTGGYKDPFEYPNMRVWPAMPGSAVSHDFHGRGRFVTAVFNQDPEIVPPWDIIFTLNDPFILDQRFKDGLGTMKQLVKAQLSYILQADPRSWFKIVSYWPVDSKLRPNWVKDTIALPDVSVSYSNYGLEEIARANRDLKADEVKDLDKKMKVIYHGYDNEHFFPISEDERQKFRKEFFQGKVNQDTFLVVSVARNQMRKDIPRTLKIFAEFKKRRPDSMLYINAKESDSWGSLRQYGYDQGLILGEDFLVPEGFSERVGLPAETLNKIYNAADVVISTNGGEGWGLVYSETLATKRLCLAPFNTTVPEIFGLKNPDIDTNARGVAMKCGSTSSEWVSFGPQDLERWRPLVNVEDAVEKLRWIYDHPEESAVIAENGYKWIQKYTWKNISQEWNVLFHSIHEDLKKDRENHVYIKKDLEDRLKG